MNDDDLDKILAATEKLQPWRPVDETRYLYEMLTDIPFCFECADWHEPYEPCSGYEE